MAEPPAEPTVEPAAVTPKYWAFISYSHKDEVWAKWLHAALEQYPIPKSLQAARPGTPRRLFPVFRDRDELPSSANLGDALQSALDQSRALVVICSPHSAQSRWVNEEIRSFKLGGRGDRIFCLVVGGNPGAPADSPEQCFPPAMRSWLNADGVEVVEQVESIAADARPEGDGREAAKLKLVAGILGVGFDALAQREARRRARLRWLQGAAVSASLAVLAGAYLAAADSQLPVPGGPAVQAWLDRHDASLFRPVHADAVVQQHTRELRQTLVAMIHRKAAKGELQDQTGRKPHMWSTSQALGALLVGIPSEPAALAAVMDLYARQLGQADKLSVGGVMYGWSGSTDAPQLESAAWMLVTSALVLQHQPALSPERQAQVQLEFETAQKAAEQFFQAQTGGWNMFPQQLDPTLHNEYSSGLALLGLLEMKSAGVGWRGDVARRDRMIVQTSDWLKSRYRTRQGEDGWVGSRVHEDRKPVSGLTMQLTATLYRAHREAGIPLPATLHENTYHRLVVLERRQDGDIENSTNFDLVFRDHLGQSRTVTQPIRFLWHPWAIVTCQEWLQAARQRPETPPERLVAIRRVLGHLVVNYHQTLVADAEKEWPWVAGEILFGLRGLAPIKPVARAP